MVGGLSPALARGVKESASYALPSGLRVRCITPPFFLATKLEALRSRGTDIGTDAEDIVTLALEVPDIVEMVGQSGIADTVRELGRSALAANGVPVSDLVDYHLDHAEYEHRSVVEQRLTVLLTQTTREP